MIATLRTTGRAGRTGLAVALACLALVLTGCAGGKQAATANERPTCGCLNTQVSTMLLRGVVIQTPASGKLAAGDDARLTVVLVNNGGAVDHLTGVSSAAFSSWGSFATAADAQSFIAAKANGAAASSGTAPALASTSVAVKPGEATSYGVPSSKGVLLLQGFKAPTVYPGQQVSITFTFAKAGSVTAFVPIAIGGPGGRESVPAISGDAEGA